MACHTRKASREQTVRYAAPNAHVALFVREAANLNFHLRIPHAVASATVQVARSAGASTTRSLRAHFDNIQVGLDVGQRVAQLARGLRVQRQNRFTS